jgi:hypothetical protein
MSERGERMEITSTDLFDLLAEILVRLATGKKHDSSWFRPVALTYEERKSNYYEAKAIIEELRKRSNSPISNKAGVSK